MQNYRDLIGLGISSDANQGFTEESKYYNPDVVQQGDNPERALELVAEYCAEKGTDINTVLGESTATCTDGKINIELQWSGPSVVQTRIAEILDEGWDNAGFNVSFDELPQDEHILQTAFAQYNVNTWRQFGATDPSGDNVWLLCRSISGISLNWPRLCDEERDALLLAAQLETDEAVRIGQYQELRRRSTTLSRTSSSLTPSGTTLSPRKCAVCAIALTLTANRSFAPPTVGHGSTRCTSRAKPDRSTLTTRESH